MNSLLYAPYEADCGAIVAVADENALQAVIFTPNLTRAMQKLGRDYPGAIEATDGWAVEAVGQIREYFSGDRRAFSLPIDFSGCSSFTREVLDALACVPYATTVSYGELAGQIGRPQAARAIGRVMAANRWPLILPCHRVVGRNGTLIGYSGGGGVSSKRWLLEFEASRVST